MAEFKMAAIINLSQNEWVSQIDLVWVRVFCKIADSKMAEFKMAKFKMTAIIKLSQNEWVKVFLCKWWEPILASVSEFERKI